ncbi:MAG: hypothetical protein AB7F86_05575 [Bdellovibrionales bacterium]
MKSVTEFWSPNLNKGLKAKADLLAGGKTPEEISASLGESFKMEGDKLKYFIAALEVASQNQEKLMRILVVSLGEGESAPPKATQIDEMHYIPEFQSDPRPVVTKKADPKAGGPKKGGKRGDGPKSSPWGLTPEEKAAKKGGGKTPPPAKS